MQGGNMAIEDYKLALEVSPDYDKCFGCGSGNPIGLKLRFQNQNGLAKAEFTPGPEYQGWPGIVHGGIIGTVLDEAMGYAALFQGKKVVTGKMEIRFRKPAPVGETLTIEGRVTRESKLFLVAEAKATLSDGTVIAEATGVMVVIP